MFFSAVSVWEIAIKRSRGKMDAPENLLEAIANTNFRELPITGFHAEEAGSLPPIHRDPFDRMLVAQARAEGLTIVTADAAIARYGVRAMAAGR